MGCDARRTLTRLAVAVAFVAVLSADLQAAQPLSVQAVRLPEGQAINLDDPEAAQTWSSAPVFEAFHERKPTFGAVPRERTTAQVLYDDQALYVRVVCTDRDPGAIRAPLVRRDRVDSTQDNVAVYVDPIGKRHAAQVFKVNAAGSVSDGIRTAADDDEDLSPDFDFEVRTVRTSTGYISLFRIPFTSLRFGSDPRVTWRLMISRTVPRESYFVWTSVPIPLDSPSFISSLPALEGFAPASTKGMWVVRPSLTVRHETEQAGGVAQTRDTSFQPSLDAKWRPIAELVIDATLRPDFSQVELDVPQLSGNKAFALSLPEKRPFFFESSDLLRSPSDAIYTRSFTAPRWGLRGTWRDEQQSATAFLVDDKGGGSTLLPHAFHTGYVKQPGSRSLSGRIQRAIDPLGRLQLGALLVSRSYEDGRGYNTSLGPDLTWQSDGPWRFRGQWLYSQTTAQPDDDGELRKGAKTSGHLVLAKAVRQTDDVNLAFTALDAGTGYRNDAGFINQTGVHRLTLHQGFAFRQIPGISELWVNLGQEATVARDSGRLVGGSFTPGIWFATANNTQFTLECHCVSRVRTDEQSAILDQRYVYLSATLPPSGRITRAALSVSLGRMADYASSVTRPGSELTASIALRPFSRLELEPSIWWASLRSGDTTVYRERVFQLLSVWHLTATQNLRLIAQKMAFERKQEDGALWRSSDTAASLTYAFTPSLGTVVFAGLNKGTTSSLGSPRSGSTEAFVKVQMQVD